MKKTFLPLSVCFLMCFSIQVLAQNDSSRTSPTAKLLSDSIQRTALKKIVSSSAAINSETKHALFMNDKFVNKKKPPGSGGRLGSSERCCVQTSRPPVGRET